jgi:hypothetical protein
MRDRIPREEIEKWLKKLKKELKDVKATNKKGKEFLDNINAYVYDCEHFLKNGDYVLSFESITWAWSYCTIGKDLGLLK